MITQQEERVACLAISRPERRRGGSAMWDMVYEGGERRVVEGMRGTEMLRDVGFVLCAAVLC